MTAPVPRPLPTTSAWSVYDWLDRSYTGAADATGTATVRLPAVPDAQRWQLTHMVAAATTTAPAPQMRLYLDSVSLGTLRDGTTSGVFDVADWPLGLWIPAGAELLAVWTSLHPGDPVTLNMQATLYLRSS